MKPDWKDAPDWANWLVMDEVGTYWWYENKPMFFVYNPGFWGRHYEGKIMRANCISSASNSLEPRPCPPLL